jgi:hypothetical protein
MSDSDFLKKLKIKKNNQYPFEKLMKIDDAMKKGLLSLLE